MSKHACVLSKYSLRTAKWLDTEVAHDGVT